MKLFDIQQAIYKRLEKSPVSIFDYVPEKTEFPYCVLGDIEEIPENTKTTNGSKVTQTIYIFSNAQGKKETFNIIEELKSSLVSDLEISDAFLVSQKISKVKVWETMDYYQGLVNLEITLDEE